MPKEKCVFCDIAAGQAPAHIVQEDSLSLALLDINPLAQGHCLVIPRRHVPWWHDLMKKETDSLFRMAQAGRPAAFTSDREKTFARLRKDPIERT